MRASSLAMAAWSVLLQTGLDGSASVKILKRLMRAPWEICSSLPQLAHFQLAVEQELEGLQVTARLGHVAAPGVQAVAVDQVAPGRGLAVHEHVGLRGE